MKRKYKYVVDEEKALRYKVLFKMFCANCTTTIDKLKDKDKMRYFLDYFKELVKGLKASPKN